MPGAVDGVLRDHHRAIVYRHDAQCKTFKGSIPTCNDQGRAADGVCVTCAAVAASSTITRKPTSYTFCQD